MDKSVVFENEYEKSVVILQNGSLPQNPPNKRRPVKKILLFGLFVGVVLFIGIFLTWHLVKETSKNDLQEMQRRQQFVKEMMLDSWNSNARDAWGHEAAAYDRSPMKFGKNSGLSIVASMSTLWTMGLSDEFELAKGWVETKLDLREIDKKVKVFDVVVNYVGGLLSCYALTGDRMFLGKAEEIAKIIEPAFNESSSGIPFAQLNLNTTSEFETNGFVFLSDAVGFQLEFNYLSQASGDDQFRKRIEKIRNFLKQIHKPNNLYMEMLGINGKWSRNVSGIFEDSREFYASLVKAYIQLNRRDGESIEMYKEALESVEAAKMFTVSPGRLYYAHDSTSASENVYPMSYSGCYLGAMFAIGANAMQQALTNNKAINDSDKVSEQNRIKRHWLLAESFTETCQQASVRTKTGLGPALFHYNGTHDVASVSEYTDQYHLSPELAESNFILWRLTHKSKYRDNAWKMAQAIHRFCRVESGGYAALISVNHIDPVYRDEVQPPIFLSATLKYLYLTFTEDSVLPLEKWVFNSVGHPLPIRGD